MSKIKILGKEFDEGDMVEVGYKHNGMTKLCIGYIKKINNKLAFFYKLSDFRLPLDNATVLLRKDIKRINKLVYERD